MRNQAINVKLEVAAAVLGAVEPAIRRQLGEEWDVESIRVDSLQTEIRIRHSEGGAPRYFVVKVSEAM